jgi:D-alanyl-D-alanine carboxypeptidase
VSGTSKSQHISLLAYSPTRLVRLMIASFLTREEIPGASVSVRVGGAHTFTLAVGTRDLAGAVTLHADARFPFYSITKLILAAAALQLVGQGRLALDGPIGPQLPEVALPAPITLRQLLGHTAGLPDYGALPAYGAALRTHPERAWTDAEFLAHTLPQGLRFPPGTSWAYSNIGYMLVRLLIERAAEQPLVVALRRLVFAPLGLRRTRVATDLAAGATLTQGWSSALDPAAGLQDIAPRYDPGWVAHGLVAGTAHELARLTEAIIAGNLLTSASRAALLAPTLLPFTHPHFRQVAYGLGTMLDPASPHGRVAGHAGGGPGYSVAAFHFPHLAGRPVTIAALLNRDRDDAALRLVFDLAEAVGGVDEVGRVG